MAAFLAVFLFILELVSCQRKVSRNVAVGADVKTVVNFNCPEEFGYYPHPNDCTQYYVCVFGGALLESCTGGLMYSHELQTCDWPRNVGCDGVELSSQSSSSTTRTSPNPPSPPSRSREEPRQRYTIPTPPPPSPQAIVTSRGQPRQLVHNQEIIKQRQQQQLYAEADETLPPAEEIESDRQQRVYRGQPSTVGQVQRDRDGLRQNAISSYSGRGDKIGVISFGTGQQYRVETSTSPPISTGTTRTLYNNSQYKNNNNNNNYDPYYTLYDDDVELYRDVDYSQQYNNQPSQSYRRTPTPIIQSTRAQDEPKRGNAAYLQNNYQTQDIYQPSTVPDYNEDNSYNSQVEDQNSYRQINRQPSRGDRNDLNYFEESTKRILTTSTTTTTTRKPTTTTTRTTTTSTTPTTTTTRTTPRTIPTKKSTVPRLPVTSNENKTQPLSLINIQENPGPISKIQLPIIQTSSTPKQNTITIINKPEYSSSIAAIVNRPSPFTLPKYITTENPLVYHYVTKSSSKSTPLVSSPKLSDNQNRIIIPTTYSPPKFFLKNILPKSTSTSTTVRTTTTTTTTTKPSIQSNKTLKNVRKLISPLSVNYGLLTATETSYESAEKLANDDNINTTPVIITTTTNGTVIIPVIPLTNHYTSPPPPPPIQLTTNKKLSDNFGNSEITTFRSDFESKLRHYIEPLINNNKTSKYRNTVEIPPANDLIDVDDNIKQLPDQLPDYKLKPFQKILTTPKTTTKKPKIDNIQNSQIPQRISRVNTAIKSLIAFGATRRQNIKCNENQTVNIQCNDHVQRYLFLYSNKVACTH